MLEVFEMAALCKIAGVNLVDRIRNDDIRAELGQKRKISDEVHERQTRWLGHVLRMDNERILKMVLEGRMEGTRRAGRPRINWPQS